MHCEIELILFIAGGAAHESGLVEVGDVVLKVNSTDLTTMSYQKALSSLRGECLVICILKSIYDYVLFGIIMPISTR